jgi:primosomal protein N' (replication factor Y)
MISKGLDFPLVSLVGIINADTTLNIPDFRSGERTFDLLYQASGRAGRSNTVGNVVIQTFNPDNFVLKCVLEQDYEKFYKYEMNIRKKLKYPPYYYLVSLKVTSKDYENASQEAAKVASYLRKNIEEESIVLGPTTSNVFKVNNIYRFQIIIKYRFDKKLMNALKELDKLFILNKKVNLELDINPIKI